MCQPASRLDYAPRRLVALAAETGDGGSAAGGVSAGGSGGAAAPEPPHRGPQPGSAWRNWNQPMPFRQKWHLAVKNTAIKIRTHQACCGNYGEPGC